MKMYDQYTNDKFFADLRSVKIDTLPGVRYGYSNEGMKLLGIILGKGLRVVLSAIAEKIYYRTT